MSWRALWRENGSAFKCQLILRVCFFFIYITFANNYLLTPLLYTLFQVIFFTMLLFYDSVLDVTVVVFVVLWIQVDSERVLPFLDILIHSMKCQK